MFLFSAETFVNDAFDDRHEDEVGDQRDVHVVREAGPTEHGFHGMTRHDVMMEGVPRETVSHFVR